MTTALPNTPPSISETPQWAGGEGAHSNLVGVVLLAGTVRLTELSRAAGRSRTDLPIRVGETLGECWNQRVGDLRRVIDRPDLPLIIATNSIANPAPVASSWSSATVRMDSELPRGSGGALRDAVQSLDPDGFVLVLPAHSYPRESLAAFVEELASSGADVAIHADMSSAPTGIFLCRCAVLASLPAKGFVDLKEQALPLIATKHDVRVVRSPRAAPLPIRTLDGYIHALRSAAGVAPQAGDEIEEDWQSTFAIAEQGSSVHATSRLHDAVILAGGRVEAGAVVVRSLVGPGGVVGAGEAVFDELRPSGASAP